MYNYNDAKYVALILNINFENFTMAEFLESINNESKNLYNYFDDRLTILIEVAKIVVIKLNNNSRHYYINNEYIKLL